jgi:hypothetical protein
MRRAFVIPEVIEEEELSGEKKELEKMERIGKLQRSLTFKESLGRN